MRPVMMRALGLTDRRHATTLRAVLNRRLGQSSVLRGLCVPCACLALFAGAGVLSACASPSVVGEVENEPVCADFTLGARQTPMKGAIKKPVKVAIVDDDEMIWSRILLAKRSASDETSKFVVKDSDQNYKVRWSQCENIFAPKRADLDVDPNAKRGGGYACGEVEEYTVVDLAIKQGDPASRVIAWQVPPDPACWQSTPVPEASSSADAGGGPPASDGTGGAGGADAGNGGGGAAASASATSSASAAPVASNEPAPKPPAPKPPAPKPPAPKPPAPKPPAPKPPAPPAPAPPAPAPAPPPPTTPTP
jgi:hypothetical protein